MTFIDCLCDYCSAEIKKYIGHYNRSKQQGHGIYCNQTCSGLDRRKNLSIEQKKKIKSDYDKQYRIKNFEKVRTRVHEWFKKDYAENPEKYKQVRKNKYPKHLQYLQTPAYKEWKRNYDELYHANKSFGEFGEAAVILFKLEKILDSQLIKKENGIYQNKSSQKRKRSWNSLQEKLSKVSFGQH